MAYVIAHRGASHHAPENTLAAFKKALELGADGIETDIQLTADRQLVIHHNYTVEATTGTAGTISKMTLEELKALNFGGGETIATLAECLETVRDMAVINLEMKAPVDRSIPYVEMVIDEVEKSGLRDKIIISAFDHSLLRAVKALCPQLRVGALTLAPMPGMAELSEAMAAVIPQDVPLSEVNFDEIDFSALVPAFEKMGIKAGSTKGLVEEVIHSMVGLYPRSTMAAVLDSTARQGDLYEYVKSLDFQLDYLHPDYHSLLADETLVSRLAGLGVGVSPYTPDAPEDLEELLQMGCYGIITNRPDILLELKAKKA